MRPAAGTPANHERRFRALGRADQVAAGRRTDARRLAGRAHGKHRARARAELDTPSAAALPELVERLVRVRLLAGRDSGSEPAA